MAVLIWDVTSAADAKDYYAACLSPGQTLSRQGYYSEGQESPGRYGGQLGEQLGLAGKVVDQATFERLCDNRHPFQDKQLTPRTNDFRRVCKDFTFSGPKSFSLIEAFADDAERKRLRKAFDEAVTETVAEDMEPDMQCRERRNGADYNIDTGNVLTAGFDHFTARPLSKEELARWLAANDNLLPGWNANDNIPPDPHCHKHLLFWNATRRADGRIMAGQFGNIVRDKGYYEAAFYSRLASKLEAMGYVIDRRCGKEWEIAGIPQSMIDKFSKRTGQIDGEAKRLGITDASEKAALGAKIRAKKQKELSLPELRQEWAKQLTAAEREALERVYRRDIDGGEEVTPQAAVAYALHYVLERDSCVPERELKRIALLYGLGHVTPEEIAAELPRQGVFTGEHKGRLMASTHQRHGQELFITGFAANGRGTVRPVGVAAGLERGILDDDQWNAVTGLLNSGDRVQAVDSAAGVGKSTMLGVFDHGMKLAGRHVTYLATTTPAVDVLRKDGFAAETVAKFLISEKMQKAAAGNTVAVDEASMLSHSDAYRLFTIAKERGLNLIFLGDSRQHLSVGAGSFMRLLKEYGGITPYRIATIKRQENADHRAAVELMFDGKAAEGFDKIDSLGWVKEITDDAQRYREAAAEYVEALKAGTKWEDLLLISPTHAEGRQAVDAVRQQLRENKMLGKEEREFTRWVSSDLREAERGDRRNYQPGKVDMIQFHQNAKGHKNGSRLLLDDSNAAVLPLDQAERFQAYRKDTVKFAVKDVIRFTGNGMTLDGHQIRNGKSYRVAGFTAKGIRLDNGWLVSKDFGHFKNGIETSLGTQSRTVSHSIVAASSRSFAAADMRAAYVTASRSRHRVSYYTDDKAGLREAIQRLSVKLVASDIVKPPAVVPQPIRSSWRQRLAHWHRLASLSHLRSAWHVPKPSPTPERERQFSHGR